MDTPLFREEAIAHQQDRSMGDVLATYSTISLLPVAVLLTMTLLLIGYLLVGDYHRKAQVQGYLVPSRGMVKVMAPRRGTVIEKRIIEGQVVNSGEVLFVLSAEQASLERQSAQSEIIHQLHNRVASLRQEKIQLQAWNELKFKELQVQRSNLEAELVSRSEIIDVWHDRIVGAEQTLQSFQQLSQKKYVADFQRQEKLDQLLTLKGELAEHEGLRLKGLNELNRLTIAIQSQPLEMQQKIERMDREIAELRQDITEYKAQRTVVIRAPSSGLATAVLLEPGQQVEAMQALVSIIPSDSNMEAHLFVPSRAIGFIAPGQSVVLRYEAFPYQRFGNHSGKVLAVSKAMTTATDAHFPFPLPESSYQVVVSLSQQTIKVYGDQLPLQAGMKLEADILLERRRIYQWLLDPLYSLARK